MKKVLLGLVVATFTIVTSCGDDNNDDPPSPPVGVFGIIGDMEGIGLDMMVLWMPNTERDLAGYNVYTKRYVVQLPPADSVIERLNASLIIQDPIMGCYFVDTNFNESSSSGYFYYVTAVDESGNESKPSGTTWCVPNSFDTASKVDIITPSDGATGVSSTPTFTWHRKPAASSYCLVLQHGAGLENLPLWVYRSADTMFSYGATSGHTYCAPTYSSLPDSSYRWQVFAIDSNYTSFASSEAYFRTGQ
jgi:hypothetical protein